jgi:signal peptidase
MEPAVKVGSLVFTTAPGGYGVGDIVTFQPDSSHHTTTHRIVDSKLEASADNDVEFVYTTKGDANEDPDINTIRETAVLGKVRLTIPYLGYPLLWAKTQKGYIFLIIVPSTVVVYSELLNIKSELISLVDKRKNKGKITTLADF